MASPVVHGQALFVVRLANGTEFVHLTQPLSDATSLGWVVGGQEGEAVITIVSGGKLTVATEVEGALAELMAGVAPPVVVSVGGASASELRTLFDRLLAGRTAGLVARPAPRVLVEGGVERRLGPAGGEAILRLEVPLPELVDPRRSAVEVLWELLPELLGSDLSGLASRIEGGVGTLEARVDPQLAEVKLRRLRLELAQFAAEARLDESRVDVARERLMVRRQARLEAHPEAAELLLAHWLEGGSAALRGYLFGLGGVTPERIGKAAESWLVDHPGAAVLVLPPRVFSPRFAPPPHTLRLDNDMSVAVLERPASPLAALSLRPVQVPDVDGELSATVLTRLAAELRTSEVAPGWVRVRSGPALLELAAPADQFAELCEVLQVALRRVAGGGQPVVVHDGGARRLALQLMGTLLGLSGGGELEPADLLRPDNLALGLVAPDGEAAVEALGKFLGDWAVPRGGLDSTPLTQGLRTRVAAPGGSSVLVIEMPAADHSRRGILSVLGELVQGRAAEAFPQWRVEVVRPLVPGHRTMLLVVGADLRLDELEKDLVATWQQLVSPVEESQLAPLRRRVAARLSAGASGAVGRARLCAAVASGEVVWRAPAELELAILSLSAEEINQTLAELAEWEQLQTTGAGALPIEYPES